MQLAAVALDRSLKVCDSFEVKVRFRKADASRACLRKVHYSAWRWAQEAVPPRHAAIAFANFLRRYGSGRRDDRGIAEAFPQLVAHHAAFDGPFLQTWYEKLGIFLPARYQVLCTLQRARWYFVEHPELVPPRDFRLATLCQYFDVPFHAATAHDALGDTLATVKLYQTLLRSELATSSTRPQSYPW